MDPRWAIEAYGPAAAAFAVFAVGHSVGAREPCKRVLGRLFGAFFVDHFWRLIYCAVSYVALYYGVSELLWGANPGANYWLVAYPPWLWQGLTALHLGSIAIVYVAFVQSDYLEFLGLRQAWRGLRRLAGRPLAAERLFGTHRLEVRGIYGWVRHPMLSGGLLFLLTSGPSLNNLVFSGLYAVYMLIGGHYEERRLIGIFGDDYRAYRRAVGGYLPRLAQLLPARAAS